MHRPDPKVPFEESVGTLVELKDQSKIQHIGLSNVGKEQIRAAQRLTPIVSIQNRYNVDDRDSESIVDLCEKEQMVFLPRAPIQDLDRNTTIRDIAGCHGASPRQVVLAWLLASSPSIMPIPGTGTVSHLEENVAAVDVALRGARGRGADQRRPLTGHGEDRRAGKRRAVLVGVGEWPRAELTIEADHGVWYGPGGPRRSSRCYGRAARPATA